MRGPGVGLQKVNYFYYESKFKIKKYIFIGGGGGGGGVGGSGGGGGGQE